MKRIAKLLLALVASVLCFVTAVACDEPTPEPPAHEHTYAETLTHDDTHHWYAATCEHTDEVKDKAEHTLTEKVVTAATYKAAGKAKKTCACGYETAEYDIAKLAQVTPECTLPTGLTAYKGETLADITLPEGWAFVDALTTLVGNEGNNEFAVKYTAPNDTEGKYLTVDGTVTVAVSKARPAYTVPTGLTATYGDTLADITLPSAANGAWSWKVADTTAVGNAGTNEFVLVFTPTDTGTYATVEETVTVAVAKIKVAKPAEDTTDFVYTQSEITYDLTVNDDAYEIIGNKKINAGEYVVSVILLDKVNYAWTDDTTADLYYEFNIAKKDASGATLEIDDILLGSEPVLKGITLSGYEISSGDYNEPEFGAYSEISSSVSAQVTFKDSSNFTGTVNGAFAVKSVAADMKTFIDFNGSIVDGAGGDTVLTPVGNTVYTNRNSKNDAMQMIVRPKEQINDGVDVSEALGKDSFTLGFSVKLDGDSMNDNNAAYQLVTSGAALDAGLDSFEFAVRKPANKTPGFRIQVGAQDYTQNPIFGGGYNRYSTYEFYDLSLEEDTWYDIVFSAERRTNVGGGAETITLTLYINGEKKIGKNTYVALDQIIGNGVLHLGGSNKGGGNTDRERPFEMDNFFLYGGIIKPENFAGLNSYIESTSAVSDWLIRNGAEFVTDLTEDYYEENIVVERFDEAADFTQLAISGLDAEWYTISTEGDLATIALKIPAANITEFVGGKNITVTLGGRAKTLSVICTDISEVESKTRTFINFNGKLEDSAGGNTVLTTVGNPTYTDHNGMGDAMKMVGKPTGQTNDGVDVSETIGKNSFTIVFDFKLYQEAFTNNGAQYELVSSGANIDSGLDTLQISVDTREAISNKTKGPRFRIQIGKSYGEYYFAYMSDITYGEWYRLVYVVERNASGSDQTNEKIVTTLYVDGIQRNSNPYIVARTNAGGDIGDGIIHLGGADWSATTGIDRPFEMDNFMLYDAAVTQTQLVDINTYISIKG